MVVSVQECAWDMINFTLQIVLVARQKWLEKKSGADVYISRLMHKIRLHVILILNLIFIIILILSLI